MRNAKKAIPERVWKLNYGWWVSVRRTSDDLKITRGGLSSRDEAERVCKDFERTGLYSQGWIGQHQEPSKGER